MMAKRIARVFAVLLLIAFNTAVTAEYLGPATVKKLKVGEGIVQVGIDIPTSNPANCTYPGYFQFDYATEHDGAVYATLLAAKVSAKKVTLELSDTACAGGRPKVKNVELH